ncbi:hypothetical protein RS399_03655 [Bacillus inaquosorum]|uniref:hypothetical protein n=1 Tax=Bacillus inaquosorum TaxID=483913 RepID=UPI0028FC23B8|nr:hypothetical protein [Bacillus inaquosorum]WNW25016.1 hypothetical protein RS399_03655 [Bacillus inaquosorum]
MLKRIGKKLGDDFREYLRFSEVFPVPFYSYWTTLFSFFALIRFKEANYSWFVVYLLAASINALGLYRSLRKKQNHRN